MRKLATPIVLGNWKMNGKREDGLALAGALADRWTAGSRVGTLGVFPPATLLSAVAERCRPHGILAGGQDCHERDSGAFTGSISAPMLADAGAEAVLVGHSERRHGLGETDAAVRAKADAALRAGLSVVVCVGETEDDWERGRTEAVLEAQLDGSLPRGEADRIVVAYEPVWAIGTGRTPSLDDISRTHRHIRGRVAGILAGGEGVPLLYGGSVKAENAAEIMAVQGVDGVLVGGACLDASGFWTIYEAGAAA